MSNPLTNYFYNSSFVEYTTLVAAILSELRVLVNGDVIRIPITYRGGRKLQTTTTNVVSEGLKSTLKFTNFAIPSEATRNRNLTHVFGESIEYTPLPVELFFEFNLRFKKFDDMSQALEQIVYHTYPHITLKTSIAGRNTESLVLSSEQYSFDNEWDGTGEEPSFYELTFTMKLNGGHLYGRNLLEDNPSSHGIIKQVNIDLGVYNGSQWSDASIVPWFKVYSSEYEPKVRFAADSPLEGEEGAYLFTYNTTPDLEVIASGNWIREDFQ